MGGIVQFLEKTLGRKLNGLVCCLHTNELPLRHLVSMLDGKTISNNQWSGSLGKMLGNVTSLEVNHKFPRVALGDDLPSLADHVVKDLSTDQMYGYKIVKAIRSGEISKSLECSEIGPVWHSRWLTTANRFCRLWISHHHLKREDLKNLKAIIQFIVGVYYPCWFQIKINPSWLDGPRHILFQLRRLRMMKKQVLDLVLPTVLRSSWFAFSESILQTLVCSSDKSEREAGVNLILNIRSLGLQDAHAGDSGIRPRKTPKINIAADTLVDLIDWKKEPALTGSLTEDELKGLLSQPMDVPRWPCHTQSVERIVKQVTEAASKVCSHKKRDGMVRAQQECRRSMPSLNSKQDLIGLLR